MEPLIQLNCLTTLFTYILLRYVADLKFILRKVETKALSLVIVSRPFVLFKKSLKMDSYASHPPQAIAAKSTLTFNNAKKIEVTYVDDKWLLYQRKREVASDQFQ